MEDARKEIYEDIIRGECQKDIIVLENITYMPYMEIEYHTQYFFIGICHSGCLKGMYDYNTVNITAGDICWTMPDHVVSHNYVSDDYNMTAIFISKEYFKQLKLERKIGKYGYITSVTTIRPSAEVFAIVKDTTELIKKLCESKDEKINSFAPSALEIMSRVLDEHIIRHEPTIILKMGSNMLLFERFYDDVAEFYRESREVNFYARRQCRSPKYFAGVIKQTTGISATEWINRYVMIEAKWMLVHDRQKSIQQIAHELGFSEQASFSRMFKNMVGMTPSAFRMRN